MSRRPAPSSWDYEERRNHRIRALREQREGPMRRRRRIEPFLLLVWLAATIALLGFLLVFGFNAFFAPRVMAWVEENPGAIEHGIVQEFVQWYRPEVLADEPASTDRRRVTFAVELGANDTQIGEALAAEGLIGSQIAFHYAVIVADRGGTLAAGTWDLSPTMRPSQIVATLRGEEFGEVASVTLREGLRIEEVVAAFGESELTMNLEEFAALLQTPPPDLLNQFDFLNDLPDGRSLEGYIPPQTLEYRVTETPRGVVEALLTQFGSQLTQEIRDGIEAKGLSVDEAVIIASLVEREAVIDDERPLIAAVYTNRYLQPENAETVGLLNADPTLQYGLTTGEQRPVGHPLVAGTEGPTLAADDWGAVDWWPQLQVAGGEVPIAEGFAGYQTYVNPGLPPTPIAAPRIGSIQAVADAPTDEGLLYFVAGCPDGVRDGSHYFATALNGTGSHNENIARANEECAGQ